MSSRDKIVEQMLQAPLPTRDSECGCRPSMIHGGTSLHATCCPVHSFTFRVGRRAFRGYTGLDNSMVADHQHRVELVSPDGSIFRQGNARPLHISQRLSIQNGDTIVVRLSEGGVAVGSEITIQQHINPRPVGEAINAVRAAEHIRRASADLTRLLNQEAENRPEPEVDAAEIATASRAYNHLASLPPVPEALQDRLSPEEQFILSRAHTILLREARIDLLRAMGATPEELSNVGPQTQEWVAWRAARNSHTGRIPADSPGTPAPIRTDPPSSFRRGYEAMRRFLRDPGN